MKKNKNYVPIIVIAVMLVLIILMYALLVFGMTSRQTEETGKYQLESISGELESTINEAKNLTMQFAIEAQTHLGDRDDLAGFIYDSKEKLPQYMDGGYNIFIAGTGWDIIPDLVNREGYVATQRGWYTGAARSGGKAYVTPPYSDAATGNICYTVSVMLGDGDTVLGIDYTMENIQAHVVKMYETGLHNAVIVTEDGIIAGGSDETLIGDTLINRLPDYTAVFHLAKNSDGFVSYRITSGLLHENLFAARSGSGWYLIVSESDWELYRSSYVQLIVTTALMLALIAVIIVLYVVSVRNRRKAEDALRSKDEFIAGITADLESPLQKIINGSDIKNYPDAETVDERLSSIHTAGKQLSYAIRQIITYSGIVRAEKKEVSPEKTRGEKHTLRMNKRFRNVILCLLIFVMAVSLIATGFLSVGLANSKMENDVNSYEYSLSEWIYKQKSILDMFTSIISTNPGILDDYESAIQYLDSIAKQYPEISVVYMTNPGFEHTVYMNNGWEPDDDWHVEERQWYIDTLSAKDGWSISAPYYDEQTGIYCVTISEQVHDDRTGEFLGNFGIDFYMDKLVEILGGSYSDSGYAFLADASGDIINHPYGTYQMSPNRTTNVSELNYGGLSADGSSTIIIRDYDNTLRIVTAKRSKLSNFTVYKAAGFWSIYGHSLIVAVLCLLAVLVSIIIVYRLLSRLIKWQDSMNRRMKEAADAATAADASKSRFLAQMSHEIRTPINAVLGMNEMILRESEDENILDYSENIQSAGKTLLSLINSILDFSKIEDGKMEIISVKYDTASMINNLVNSVSGRAKSKGLEFVVNADPRLPCMLVGDDMRLTQVIMNLLTNAVKYTEKGGVVFSISASERSDTSVTLAVFVKDTGIGIREEDMGRLFESFSRLDETRNRNIEGTGLGMTIVTKLLELMGSKLKVESIYGSGSTFSFTVKQDIADPRPIGNKIEHRSDTAGRRKKEKRHFFGAKVLVTDDNDMNLKVAQNLLKLFGIKADLASSGEETIDKMQEKRYDIVFLDHMMPQMDGIETLARLKELELIPDGTVMIALTANAIMGAKEQYIDAGFTDYLSKPIELDHLKDMLIKYLPKKITRNKTLDDSLQERSESSDVTKLAPTDKDEVIEFEAVADNETYEIMEFMPSDDSLYDETANGDMLGRLEEAGLSVKSGMKYCAGDMAFYRKMLSEYADTAESRLSELRSALSDNDTEQYCVLVHALKSISRTVGADDVSELAKSLEDAAKNNDLEYIQAHGGKLERMLTERAAIIKKNLKQI